MPEECVKIRKVMWGKVQEWYGAWPRSKRPESKDLSSYCKSSVGMKHEMQLTAVREEQGQPGEHPTGSMKG